METDKPNPDPVARAKASRRMALDKIQAAQSLILDARALLSPIEGKGYDKVYSEGAKQYDAIKQYWHKVNNLADPTGYFIP